MRHDAVDRAKSNADDARQDAGTRAANSDTGAAAGRAAKPGNSDADRDAGPDADASTTETARAGAGGNATGGAAAQAGAGGRRATMEVEPPPDDGAPTWSGIYTYELRSCKAPNCHGGGLAGIDMSTRQGAYDSLVNQPSDATRPCARLGKMRVVPGAPENSLLYLKLNIDAPCGQQMPPGGQLSQKARDRVRDWIMLGAKND